MAGFQQTTTIPDVPLRSKMFDEQGNLTRTWILFFERQAAQTGSGSSRFIRTLDVKDSTVGDNIADVLTIYADGLQTRVIGILRTVITSALTVVVRLTRPGVFTSLPLITCTIPAPTALNTPVEFTDFNTAIKALQNGDVLAWDITASDGAANANGIASFTLEWIAP